MRLVILREIHVSVLVRITRLLHYRVTKSRFERVAELVASGQFLLTVTAILIQLLIHLFHPLDVDARVLAVIHHRQRVLLADDALGGVLYTERRVPGLVNVPDWEVLQHRQVAPDQ